MNATRAYRSPESTTGTPSTKMEKRDAQPVSCMATSALSAWTRYHLNDRYATAWVGVAIHRKQALRRWPITRLRPNAAFCILQCAFACLSLADKALTWASRLLAMLTTICCGAQQPPLIRAWHGAWAVQAVACANVSFAWAYSANAEHAVLTDANGKLWRAQAKPACAEGPCPLSNMGYI